MFGKPFFAGTRSKYGNKKTVYNGRSYDSGREARHAMLLDDMLKKKEITGWEPQVRFRCEVNGKKVCDYFADFVVDYPGGRQEVVDVKGFRTDVYRLKKKLVEACFGVEIVEA